MHQSCDWCAFCQWIIANRNLVIPIVILLMPRFSLTWLLALVVLASVICGLIYSKSQYHRAVSEISELNERLADNDVALANRDSDMSHSRMGMSFLASLVRRKENESLFRFLESFRYGSMSAYVEELPGIENAKLYVYWEYGTGTDGRRLGQTERSKTAWLLIENDTKNILGFVHHIGYYSRTSGSPQILHLQNIDGTETKYKILSTGFEPFDRIAR